MGGGGLDVRMQGNGKQSQQRAMGPEMSCQAVSVSQLPMHIVNVYRFN